MLGMMALRARARPRDRMALATAVLGLAWNAGALFVYGLRDLGLVTPPAWLTALAFSALGFLPAVMVQAAAQRLVRPLVAASYLISGAAAAMQFGSTLDSGAS